VNRASAELWSDAIGAAGTVIRYGHSGRAVLVLPTERGRAVDFENNGMLAAFHAANFALKRADTFPQALYFSGNYDPSSWHGWGERGTAAYLNNPLDYVSHLHGEHLDWLRSSRQFAALLAAKNIRHELDLWGHDVPHDWPSWRAQLAHHLPRFC
jgi:esterase/lipase superfamily enzyme